MYQQCEDWITEEKNVLVLQNLIRKHRQNSFPPSHKFFLFHIIQSDTLRYYEQVDNKIIFSESIKSTFIVKRGKIEKLTCQISVHPFFRPQFINGRPHNLEFSGPIIFHFKPFSVHIIFFQFTSFLKKDFIHSLLGTSFHWHHF